jgi:hypothetical protein
MEIYEKSPSVSGVDRFGCSHKASDTSDELQGQIYSEPLAQARQLLQGGCC